MSDRIFIARHAFWYHDENGDPQFVGTGVRVREGHSILRGREHLFRDDDVLEPDTGSDDEEVKLPARRGRPPKSAE